MAEVATNQPAKKAFTTRQVVLIGVMGAIVFVTNYISFTIPLLVGEPTRIHIANIFCLLAGMLLGPVSGGLSAGIGSMFYDFTNPMYVASSPFTFAFKFLMAFVAGKLANAGGKSATRTKQNILACITGQSLYIVLYLGKKFISGVLLGNAVPTVLVACATAGVTSLINGVFSVIVAVMLAPIFRKAMPMTGTFR